MSLPPDRGPTPQQVATVLLFPPVLVLILILAAVAA